MDLVTATLPFSFHVLHSILQYFWLFRQTHPSDRKSFLPLLFECPIIGAALCWEGPVEIAYSINWPLLSRNMSNRCEYWCLYTAMKVLLWPVEGFSSGTGKSATRHYNQKNKSTSTFRLSASSVFTTERYLYVTLLYCSTYLYKVVFRNSNQTVVID